MCRNIKILFNFAVQEVAEIARTCWTRSKPVPSRAIAKSKPHEPAHELPSDSGPD
jgi:hypothetical protein